MPSPAGDLVGFKHKLKQAMSRALKECPLSRAEVAVRMAEELGQDTFSLATLNQYTAESNDTHEISLNRFKAFVRATGAVWLVDFAFASEGVTMLIGDEARLAEAALVRQQKRELEDRLKLLEAQPVQITRRHRP